MNNELSRRQRLRFFFLNVAAFAAIFLALGFITLQILHSSAYRQTDEDLKQITPDSPRITMEIQRYQADDPFLGQNTLKPPLDENDRGNHFNSQIILWSKEGQILNKAALGGRFNELQSLSLDTKKLNTVKEINLASSDTSDQLTFHSITLAVSSQLDEDIAYVQVLENTDQISQSMATVQTILILCMIFFWLLSIGVSYLLSKQNMKPIFAAWKKQQEFVENASHELRTPLTIIQNSLQRLFTKPEHTILDESETIAQALNETRRLTGLTNDLLTIARSDSNEAVLDKQPLNPELMIANLVKPFQEIAQMDQKTFILENFAKQTVTVDEKKVHQLLVILLDNALKYTSAGDKIVLQSEISGDSWLLEVKNSGPNIPDEEKKQIFERFHRMDPSRTKESGGYGLGLAIAKQIVADHKGKIAVQDWQPKGVIFRIKLPVK
ncbi:HAMP domain-containing sensor histidine kinase [Enterococcus asini]|uniref:sensor histidine kinase n=1 Tax=Enterococcus asini TaxID=57732 RepID=UPI00288E069C|nr:HAMP domain-containing sensor histidine kinase [Enterococcus asini]MDT2757383.1 HAMP domain-containing sensor histidine kinase [Enterococcus asini]